MADKRIAWSQVENVICEETGLDREDLVLNILKKISKDLMPALKVSKNMRDPKPFIDEWNNVINQSEASNKQTLFDTSKFVNLRKEVELGITNVKSRFIDGVDYFDGTQIARICVGYITTGIYDGANYSYFTKGEDEGRDKLIDFITRSILDDRDDSNVKFDEFIDNTLLISQNRCSRDSNQKDKEVLKEVTNVV